MCVTKIFLKIIFLFIGGVQQEQNNYLRCLNNNNNNRTSRAKLCGDACTTPTSSHS